MKTKEKLIAFENWVADEYHKGNIRSPTHLSGGNEEQLIKIFKQIKPNDWIFTTYRSHYHALLKGMSEEDLKKWILDNKSIHLMNKEHKIISSAIVGGTLSQAVGTAMGIKYNAEVNHIYNIDMSKYDSEKGIIGTRTDDDHVWCFCGDMTSSLGVFHDCVMYSYINNLPITFVVEDNGLSTDTPTKEAWGGNVSGVSSLPNVIRYEYTRTWPHYGTGKKVEFKDDKT